MAEEAAAISVKKTLYSGTETPIPPGGGGTEKKVEFLLEKIASEEAEPDPDWYDPGSDAWSPGTSTFGTVPYYSAVGEKSAIIDIETTGTKPWESRITCIGVKLLGDPSLPVMQFTDEDEATLLRAFANWFTGAGLTELIGYNVIFDVRFIFVACMRYRIKLPPINSVTLYDLMQTMEQVWQKFIYGNNAAGTLDNWCRYLFNEEKPGTTDAMMKAWADKNFDKIKEFNRWDLEHEFLLLSLIEYTLTY